MAKHFSSVAVLLFFLSLFSTSCLTPKKLDAYVSEQFNNELPKPDKKKDSSIFVTSSLHSDPAKISVTQRKTSKVLPLIVYWQFDYRHTCTLNPAIGINYFKKTISQQTNKLKQKLDGKQLELNVEQLPGAFAFVDKAHFLLFLIHWDKLYVEPDPKDLIISYRLLQNGSETKTGRITVINVEKNRNIRYFQSWKSSASEFLGQYNLDIAEMTKTFTTKLLNEL